MGGPWALRETSRAGRRRGECPLPFPTCPPTPTHSALLPGPPLQHQHAPLRPLPRGHLPARVRPESLHQLPGQHQHGLRRLHQRHTLQKYVQRSLRPGLATRGRGVGGGVSPHPHGVSRTPGTLPCSSTNPQGDACASVPGGPAQGSRPVEGKARARAGGGEACGAAADGQAGPL